MRTRISQSNIFPDFDLFTEYQKIEHLISEEQVIGTYNQFGSALPPRYTIEEYINQFYFKNWSLRGTYLPEVGTSCCRSASCAHEDSL